MPDSSATVFDPDGREAGLDPAAWRHILSNHPEMAEFRAAILRTVERPDRRLPGPRPLRERFYRRREGPSRWCMVVVDFAVQPARVVTAFALRAKPGGRAR